jgi:hypothetical protein
VEKLDLADGSIQGAGRNSRIRFVTQIGSGPRYRSSSIGRPSEGDDYDLVQRLQLKSALYDILNVIVVSMNKKQNRTVLLSSSLKQFASDFEAGIPRLVYIDIELELGFESLYLSF